MPSLDDQLAEFHKLLQDKVSLFDALMHITETLKKALSAERASLLIYDRDNEQLWSVVDEQQEKIVVPYDQGIVGATLRTGRVQLENEPYDNPNFFSEVDMQLGFYTQSILAAPLFDDQQNIIGVIELLNKPGGFTKDDKNFVYALTHALSKHITLAQKSTLQTDQTT